MIAHIRIIFIFSLFLGTAPLYAMEASAQTIDNSRKRAAEPSSEASATKRVTREENENAANERAEKQTDEQKLEKLNKFLQTKGTSVEQIMAQPDFNPNTILFNRATFLQYAAAYGVSSLVQSLIEEYNAEIDLRAKDTTALHMAVIGNHSEVVRFLLSRNANVNVQDEIQDTPLHRAASAGNAQLVQLLLEGHSEVDAKGYKGSTPLHRATKKNAFPIVKLLLNAGAAIDEVEDHGGTALAVAACEGSLQCARLLLDKMASIDKADIDNRTPLHHASAHGHSHLVELLLQYNADKNVKDRTGKTPWNYAPNMRISKLLSDQIPPFLTFSLPSVVVTSVVAARGDIHTLRKNRTYINHCMYPIHAAIATGQIEAVKVLIDMDAHLDVLASDGQTPLHVALYTNHIDIAELIIDTIVKKQQNELLNKKDAAGKTPLIVAASICLPSTEPIIQRLRSLGVDETGFEESLPEFMRVILAAQPNNHA